MIENILNHRFILKTKVKFYDAEVLELYFNNFEAKVKYHIRKRLEAKAHPILHKKGPEVQSQILKILRA